MSLTALRLCISYIKGVDGLASTPPFHTPVWCTAIIPRRIFRVKWISHLLFRSRGLRRIFVYKEGVFPVCVEVKQARHGYHTTTTFFKQHSIESLLFNKSFSTLLLKKLLSLRPALLAILIGHYIRTEIINTYTSGSSGWASLTQNAPGTQQATSNTCKRNSGGST